MIELGTKVKDNITGFTGIAMGVCEYRYGCRQIQVLSSKLSEGKEVYIWFDEQRLTSTSKVKTGGPQHIPPPPKPPTEQIITEGQDPRK